MRDATRRNNITLARTAYPSPRDLHGEYLVSNNGFVAEDADLKQARVLVGLLQATIAEVSQRLEAPEIPARGAPVHDQAQPHRQVESLRREFHEAHRLLDGLYRRFPEMVQDVHPARSGGPAGLPHQPRGEVNELRNPVKLPHGRAAVLQPKPALVLS